MRVRIVGATNWCVWSNGTFQLTYLGSCEWRFNYDADRDISVFIDGPVWALSVSQESTDQVNEWMIPAGSWSCLVERDDWRLNVANIPGTEGTPSVGG